MTHFVLFHGAWHQGSAWDRVVPLLTEHGHTAVTPSLRADAGTRKWRITWPRSKPRYGAGRETNGSP